MVITSPAGEVAKYCNEHVCLCVCLSTCISPICAIFTQFFVHIAYGCGLVLLRRGDEIPRGRGNFGSFLSIDNFLYSIAFGTHTNTAEPIEMMFGSMTRVGPRYCVGWGPDPIFGGNVAAHCKVMGHSTVSCAKTTEPIDMPFEMKTLVVPWNHVLDGCIADPSSGRGNFGGCLGHSKALAILAAPNAAASLQKGLFNHQ